MLRIRSLYSFFMIIAGASLTADVPETPELPGKTVDQELRFADVDRTPLQPAQEPACQVTITQHLETAIQHLHAAGLDEDAARIQQLAVKHREARQAEFIAKQEQLQLLQAEVTAMRHELGLATVYALNCTFGQIDLAALRKQNFDWNSIRSDDAAPLPADRDWQSLAAFAVDPSKFNAFLRSMQRNSSAKVLAEPQMVLTLGRPVSLRAGPALPKVLQVGHAEGETKLSRETLSFNAVLKPMGNNRVQVNLASTCLIPEEIQRQLKEETPVQGKQSFETVLDMQIGETKLFSYRSPATEENVLNFVVVTVAGLSRE